MEFVVESGDLLIAMSGATTGKVGVYNDKQRCLQNQRVGNFKIPSEKVINKKFRNYFIFSLRKKIETAAHGGAQPNISASILESFEILLPPINEQERIVEKIEELFSDVDQGVESLKTEQKQLKVYRQAVLKWAFEGKLTEAWRTQHQATLKTGEALLAEIKAERENRYQQQLAEWETAVKECEAIGKTGKKPATN